MLMWPAEPEDLVRHITRGEIKPIMKWLDKGPTPVNHARTRTNSPPRSPPGAPSPGTRKPGAAKMKRPARPPSAPVLSSLPAKPPRPQSAATGLLRPQSAATGLLRPQSAVTGFQHTPSAALLGQATAQHKPRPKKTLPVSATQAELTRPLKRTTSGNTLPPRRGHVTDDGMDGPVVLGGPGGQAAMSHAAGRRAQMRHASSMQALQSPYNQSIHQPKRGGAGGGGGGQGFRSEALQLEVKLAEGLQVLQNAEARAPPGEAGEKQRRRQRLALFRSLWEKVIERDASFGVLLRRIKAEYESALTVQGGGMGPERGDAAAMRRENLELKQRLQQASRREHELSEQLEAYEAKLYEQQRQLQQQGAALAQQRMYDQQQAYEDEEAMAAEVAAQLAEEMPASARPGSITPSLGSGRLATIQPPPAQPACIPSLDMNIVAVARDAEARAEAEAAAEEAAAEEAAEAEEAAAAGDGAYGGARRDSADDYGSDEEGEASSDEVRPPARPGIVPSLGAGLAAMGNLPRADYHEEFMALEAQAAGPKYDGGEVDSIVQQVDDRMYAQDPSRGRPDCEPRVLSEGAVEG